MLNQLTTIRSIPRTAGCGLTPSVEVGRYAWGPDGHIPASDGFKEYLAIRAAFEEEKLRKDAEYAMAFFG